MGYLFWFVFCVLKSWFLVCGYFCLDEVGYVNRLVFYWDECGLGNCWWFCSVG